MGFESCWLQRDEQPGQRRRHCRGGCCSAPCLRSAEPGLPAVSQPGGGEGAQSQSHSSELGKAKAEIAPFRSVFSSGFPCLPARQLRCLLDLLQLASHRHTGLIRGKSRLAGVDTIVGTGTVLSSDTASAGACVAQLLCLGLFVEKTGPGKNCSPRKLFYLIYRTCGELCRAIYVAFPICSNAIGLNQTDFVAETSLPLLRSALF